MSRKLLHTVLLLLTTLASYADEKSLDTLVLKSLTVSQILPQERVYLHFDNDGYYLGETMWFKAYVTSGIADEEKPQSRYNSSITEKPTIDIEGIGTTTNNALAHKWYMIATDSSYTLSMSMLVKSYEERLLTEKNSEKAIEWYKHAAEQGSEYGKVKAKEYELFKFYK